MKFRPTKFRRLPDRILVRPVAPLEQSSGGVRLDSAANKLTEGEIVAMGPGRRRKGLIASTNMAVGDHVLFAPTAGRQRKVSGQDLLVIRMSELLGVITRSALPGEPTTGPAPPTRKVGPGQRPGNRVRGVAAEVRRQVGPPGHDQMEGMGLPGEPTIGPGRPRPGSDCYLPALAKQLGYKLPDDPAVQGEFWEAVSRRAIYNQTFPPELLAKLQPPEAGKTEPAK